VYRILTNTTGFAGNPPYSIPPYSSRYGLVGRSDTAGERRWIVGIDAFRPASRALHVALEAGTDRVLNERDLDGAASSLKTGQANAVDTVAGSWS
jgi:hypothetical protein